jgi:secreted PhoX family phosphatase
MQGNGLASGLITRREALHAGLLAGTALAFGPGLYRSAFAAAPAVPGPGPYGPPGAFDANGIAAPPGFSSRLIAVGGQPVADTGYAWHVDTDGQGTFAMTDGGWILTANSETAPHEGGGASMIRFDSAGNVVDARRILSLTNNNCAGGPTPWGTWLSCEEWGGGFVHECDPTGSKPAIARPAMGQFTHEAVTVDPERQCLYMTEDESDGCFYRFTPRDYPDLSLGTLEVCIVAADGSTTRLAQRVRIRSPR